MGSSDPIRVILTFDGDLKLQVGDTASVSVNPPVQMGDTFVDIAIQCQDLALQVKDKLIETYITYQ